MISFKASRFVSNLLASIVLLTAVPVFAADIWIPTGAMSSHRQGNTATKLNDGRVLVTGGLPGGTTVLSVAEIYDPTSGSWTFASPMNEQRYLHTATLLQDGRILVVGGTIPGSTFSGTTTAEIYDPTNNSWSYTGSLANRRSGHTATLLQDGRVLVVAGSGSFTPAGTAELYDPATGTWSSAGSVPNGHSTLHTATLLLNGDVLVVGGVAVSASCSIACSNQAELYSPTTNTWSTTGNLLVGRAVHTATLLNNGKVLITGGRGSNSGSSLLASTEVFDPATGLWASAGNMASKHNSHAATLMADGQVIVTGGTNGDSNILFWSTELYDATSSAWSKGPQMIYTVTPGGGSRIGHNLTLLNDGRILASGGTNSIMATAEMYGPIIDADGPVSSPNQSPAANAAGWNTGAVMVSWNWSDVGASGVNILKCPQSSQASGEGSSVTVTSTCTDYAYNVSTSTYSVKIDGTAPSISGTTTSPNADGWYNSDLVINWSCSDTLSGVADCPTNTMLNGEGAGLSGTGTATDIAGNQSTFTISDIKIDRTNPTISVSAINADSSPYIAGSETSQSVTVHFMCSDLLSGIATCPSDQTFTAAGTIASVVGTSTDNAGNLATTSFGPIVIVNHAPELSAIGNKSVSEGQLLTFQVSATDADGDGIIYSASYLPEGASLDENTGAFSWTPSFSQAGTYPNIVVTATDDSSEEATDTELITISVVNVNRAPVLGAIGPRTVDEGNVLQIILSASDADGDPLSYEAINLPPGSTFSTSTRTLSWTPSFSQSGIYSSIVFSVSDNGTPSLSDSEAIAITVTDVAPLVLTPVADSFLREGAQNRNEGANPHLFVQTSGHNRAIIMFDQAAINNYIAAHGVSNAKLVLTIAANGTGWGSTGRTIDVHRLMETFAEGNGKDSGLPNAQSTRGNGNGVTWNCSVDSVIENNNDDCAGQWNGGSFASVTAPSQTILNNQMGEMQWDVTQDVVSSSAYQWLTKKTIESQAGGVEYYSREGAAAASNMTLAPRLILTP